MAENQPELTYIERAEEAILAAAIENDVANRYFYQRQAELCIRLAEVEQSAVANSVADKQAKALSSIGVSLKRMDQYITVRTSRR